MNVVDKIKELMTQIKSLWGAITDLQDGVDIAGSHDLLSATHPDTTVGSPARGDLVTGQGVNPLWTKLAKGANKEVLKSDGTDLAWGSIPHADTTGIGEDNHHAKVHTLDSTVAHSAATDNTDHNVSKDIHGLCPKLSDDDTEFLSGKGTWLPAGAGSGHGWTFFDPLLFPVGYAAQCDHFDDDALDGKWAEFDPGGSPALTLTEADHHLKLAHATEGAWAWRGAYQTLPSGNFTVITKVGLLGANVDTRAGLALFEDADGNPTTCDIVIFELKFTGAGLTVAVVRYSHYQGWSANYYGSSFAGHTAMFLRIRRNSTTLYFDISTDGVGWEQLLAQAEPFAAEQMGVISLNNNSGITGYSWFDFFYYKASDDFMPMGRVRSI